MQKYFGVRISETQTGVLKYKFPDGKVRMPCGFVAELTGKDQRCPNSGACAAGHGECWAEQYVQQEPKTE